MSDRKEANIQGSKDAAKPIRPGHLRLVGPPLVLIIVFCFALVLAHPQSADDASARTAGSAPSKPALSDKHKVKADKPAANTHDSKPSSKTSDLHAGSSSGSSGTGGPAGGAQPQGASPQQGSDQTDGLQSAVQNHSDKPIKSVTDGVKHVVNNLTGITGL